MMSYAFTTGSEHSLGEFKSFSKKVVKSMQVEFLLSQSQHLRYRSTAGKICYHCSQFLLHGFSLREERDHNKVCVYF